MSADPRSSGTATAPFAEVRPSPPRAHRPVVLVIRDGWGRNPHAAQASSDATALASTPVAARLLREYPNTLIRTSGEDVGLPITDAGPVMGNSEVGHQNIGAGRIVDQELMRITRTVRDGSFFGNAALRGAFGHARRGGGRVHLLGLASDGLVHSDLAHLEALLELARLEEFRGERVAIHAITDGRDTPPTSAAGYLERIERAIGRTGCGRIASVIGRFYAMDRDFRWERIEEAWRCLTTPTARRAATWREAVQRYYDAPSDESRRGDEFILPTQVVPDRGKPVVIGDGDAVIFFNFRGDRPRELSMAFVLGDEAWRGVKGGGFERGRRPERLSFVTMTAYEEGLPTQVAFQKPPRMSGTLGETLSKAGLAQLRCAETEKYPHVTFFFNDYREEPFPGERRILIPSPRDVTTYDQKPEMSADAVCQAVLDRIAAPDGEPAIIANFANPDMVGHTGKLEAVVVACETVDRCTGLIVDAALARGGAAIVAADHGNAEQMWDPIHDCPHTAHTNYDVPVIVVAEDLRGGALRADGRLADLAPTMLDLLGVPKPAEMTGRSLIVR
ncbi:MAG TPA: 2,3-bisphosphoglycerate-independent phosphoglycerate mutase [Phycisphaerales bacterium]|nr:2,3-bisphosphoglycerate-independent phosphoglycerate mutase [Phycisphaerales bacterium]HMP37207.1 2,3-bisphosphoglycerate-independent phosphoglycerate mutase [Phycisphaerales bacterium]